MRIRGIALAAVLLAGCTSGATSEGESPGVRAAGACLDAWHALAAHEAGTRSLESATSKMENAADDAREAAVDEPKYRPLVEWIVGAQAEMRSGSLGENARELAAECGPNRN